MHPSDDRDDVPFRYGRQDGTIGHSLLVPKRHVANPDSPYQLEVNAMWALSAVFLAPLAADETITRVSISDQMTA
jgi:hypothetical protein